MADTRTHYSLIGSPQYRVEGRNNGDIGWRVLSQWYREGQAMEGARRAMAEMGFFNWPLYPHVRVVHEGVVIAAWKDRRALAEVSA